MAKSSNTHSNSRRTNKTRTRKVLSEEDVNKGYESDDSPAWHDNEDYQNDDKMVEEEEEEEEEEEYDVERVVGHKRERGKLMYRLKWKGYSSNENTWERESNVHCQDLVEEYWRRIVQDGGSRSDPKGQVSEQQPTKRKAEGNMSRRQQESNRRGQAITSKKRRAETISSNDDDYQDGGEEDKSAKLGRESKNNRRGDEDKEDKTDKRSTKSTRSREDSEHDSELEEIEEAEEERKWAPSKDWTSWGNQIDQIRTIVQADDDQLTVYLRWKNGRETNHPIETAHDKFPLTLIRYYESHLRFIRVIDQDP
ncbi:hypothetical protein BGZ95_003132 [Linnemannia exigua]|uniref:Chromo domain-containing protein n=1 Tax=Linnemannia exigua TaxID=604196 RepID=A0AAD4HB23_9FUNG|nr:hypothetical protein BGZ95_003132 [Linnemannia exigua]